jgi:hypothetical protein
VSGRCDSETKETEAQYIERMNFAETAYFHPFVQDFLFGGGHCEYFHRKPGEEIRTLRVAARYGYGLPDFLVDLAVDRCELAIIAEPGLALLTLEVAAGPDTPVRRATGATCSFSLGDALALHDCLRRVYPPYFTGPGASTPYDTSLFPINVEINPKTPLADAAFPSCAKLDYVKAELLDKRRCAYAPWWKEILGPVAVPEIFSQISDDRIPTMVFVVAKDIEAIGRADRVRLAFADHPGSGYPYAEVACENFEDRHAYRLFEHYGTHHYVTAFSYTCLAQGDADNPNDFAIPILQEHFRRHYARMFFIVQMQKAGLLMFSNFMAQAHANAKKYGDHLRDTRNLFLRFTHATWFSNVSNQEQARALFAMMQEHSGNVALYEEVNNESAAARDELQLLTDAQIAQSDFMMNIFFGLATFLGLPPAILSGAKEFLPDESIPDSVDFKCVMAISFAVSTVLILTLLWKYNRSGPGGPSRLLTVIVVLLALVCAGFAVVFMRI